MRATLAFDGLNIFATKEGKKVSCYLIAINAMLRPEIYQKSKILSGKATDLQAI